MMGNVQDLVSAAVVFSAVDSAGRSASMGRSAWADNKQAGDASAGQQAGASAPMRAVAEGQRASAKADAEREVQEAAAEKEPKLDEKTVDFMTQELNELMNKINCNLQFKYHKEVGVMSVKMIDKSTRELIKEFPPEEMVKNMMKAREWIGAFLDKKA